MKVLVVGSGGREHTLVWKLKGSKKVAKIFCAPGNGGIYRQAKCVNIKADNIKGLADFAFRNKINLSVVGPEAPLARGIVDEFQRRKLKIFGPDKKGAQLESSKVFSKEFMRRHHIPTASFRVFSSAAEAIGFCKSVQFPAVIKADGLAAGKGAVIVRDLEQASSIIEDIMLKKIFGDAGDRIVIESFLVGQEVSIMALADGKTIVPLLPSQDHKQAYDGDRGPNTGGMGAYCPVPFLSPEVMRQIEEHILIPTINGLIKENITYKGVLYAGLMLTETGPKVLEFNCRFGDPETQAVLPLLKTDLYELMTAVVNQKLSSFSKLDWRNGAAACVVMASRGYPGKYTTGVKIGGLENIKDDNVFVFHAGTERKGDRLVTSGGRVLGITGLDSDLKLAINRAYRHISRIKFEGAMFRRDIGSRPVKPINK
ncbi:MAG: phosphoribosylamine--glycine ligase [Candidatus Zixiibacteriota bacterium]|nr:MAG: phosphoribosylamine--glycine ligase [candidate division Zixibacteria bacterium]